MFPLLLIASQQQRHVGDMHAVELGGHFGGGAVIAARAAVDRQAAHRIDRDVDVGLDHPGLQAVGHHIDGVDAARRGIEDGDEVTVFNARGTHRCVARVSARARPGVVNGLGIWWRKLGRDGTNVNELTSQRLTDMGRAPTFYDCAVEVKKS